VPSYFFSAALHEAYSLHALAATSALWPGARIVAHASRTAAMGRSASSALAAASIAPHLASKSSASFSAASFISSPSSELPRARCASAASHSSVNTSLVPSYFFSAALHEAYSLHALAATSALWPGARIVAHASRTAAMGRSASSALAAASIAPHLASKSSASFSAASLLTAPPRALPFFAHAATRAASASSSVAICSRVASPSRSSGGVMTRPP